VYNWVIVGKSGDFPHDLHVGWEKYNVFLGEFTHSIDDKGRLALPAKFRPALAEGVVVTRGLDGCLFVFTKSAFDVLAGRAGDIPITNTDGRDFVRMLCSGASDIGLDKQGRILVPQVLREFAGLDGEVVVVGVNTRIEVWSQAAWKSRREKFEGGALDAEHWAQLGI
jgi:MraZ protein